MRILVNTRVRHLMKPAHSQLVSSESLKTLITKSDLLSGGLKTELYCLLSEDSLKRMLESAKESQNQNLIEMI